MFDRGNVSEFRVSPQPVVEDLDVLEYRVGEVDSGAPFLPVQQLDLHARPEGQTRPIGGFRRVSRTVVSRLLGWVGSGRVGSDQFRFEFSGDEVLEVFPSEAFVADDDLAGADEMAFVAEHRFGGFAFSDFRVRQSPDDGHSVGGADQVKAKSPEISGV